MSQQPDPQPSIPEAAEQIRRALEARQANPPSPEARAFWTPRVAEMFAAIERAPAPRPAGGPRVTVSGRIIDPAGTTAQAGNPEATIPTAPDVPPRARPLRRVANLIRRVIGRS